jgi:N-acetylglutamate synthase-like GNAT family acetyltransferase
MRLAMADDVVAIRGVVRDAYSHYVARIGRDPAPMTVDYDAVVAQRHVWVAEESAEVVGAVVLEVAGDKLLIENLAVAPLYQRRGVGGTLLAFAEERAETLGLGEITLYTHVLMTENQAYYSKRGYLETHRSDSGGFARVHYAKQIERPYATEST